MATISLKLPDPLARRLAETARSRRTSKSAIVRDALDTYLSASEPHPEGSALAFAADVKGVLAGPPDLSCNKEHMRGFGR
ncbi:MAG: ribbon-helix-helix protein, CopG family [bacterium]|nr:ribbon-helix-helix protein, CopG family [bacterium]MDE0242385.1 ribbon-helix-helix protein, CopG family [bacterium]